MILGRDAFGALALGEEPGTETIVATVFPLLLADPDSDLIFVLLTNPAQRAATISDFPYALGEEPMSSLDSQDASIREPLRFSDFGLRTIGTDTPANTDFPPRLVVPYQFDVELPISGDGDSLASLGFGRIRILNTDRGVDSLLGRAWEGSEVEVFAGGTINPGRNGERTLLFSEYGLIFRGVVEAVESNLASFDLRIRDPFARLDIPVQTTLYAGTGGLEGSTDLEGVPKPKRWGRVRNASPQLVDEANLIYQLHDAAIQGGPNTDGGHAGGAPTVRDKGIEITLDTAIGTNGKVTDIESATPAAGKFIFQSESTGSYIKLGALPDGQVTVDLDGDATGGYVESTKEILRRIATSSGGILDPEEIDAASFGAFADPGPIGYEVTAPRDVSAVLQELAFAADAWITWTRDGRLRIGRHVTPERTSPVASIGLSDVSRIAVEPAPPATWRVRVGYDVQWTVQTEDELAASVPASDKDRFSTVRRLVVRTNETVRSLNLRAQEFELPTFLAVQADAQTLADAVFDRLRKRRIRVGLVQERAIFQVRQGDVVQLTDMPMGIRSGPFWVRSLSEDARQRRVEMELWGEPGALPTFILDQSRLGTGTLG